MDFSAGVKGFRHWSLASKKIIYINYRSSPQQVKFKTTALNECDTDRVTIEENTGIGDIEQTSVDE